MYIYVYAVQEVGGNIVAALRHPYRYAPLATLRGPRRLLNYARYFAKRGIRRSDAIARVRNSQGMKKRRIYKFQHGRTYPFVTNPIFLANTFFFLLVPYFLHHILFPFSLILFRFSENCEQAPFYKINPTFRCIICFSNLFIHFRLQLVESFIVSVIYFLALHPFSNFLWISFSCDEKKKILFI